MCLSNEIKCAIVLFIFYTPSVVKTFEEIYVKSCGRPVVSLSQGAKIGCKGGKLL